MFSKMLKLTSVLFVLTAFIVVPAGILSGFSDSADPEEEINQKCAIPWEASVVPVKDKDNNPTKACSDYSEADCEGATAQYNITEAAGCDGNVWKLKYNYYYCVTKKKAVPNGNCTLDTDNNCTDDTSYEESPRYYKSECSDTIFQLPQGM